MNHVIHNEIKNVVLSFSLECKQRACFETNIIDMGFGHCVEPRPTLVSRDPIGLKT